MTGKKDFIELGDWQLNVFKQKVKYKQALEEIRENILLRYSICENKEMIAIPLEDLWCIKELIDEVLNDRD